jgi:excisionase family DNA binding protein
MPEIKPNEIYTTEEARDYLKVSNSTFKRYLKRGIIKAYKVGGRYKILGREILGLISPSVEKGGERIYLKIKNKIKELVEKW